MAKTRPASWYAQTLLTTLISDLARLQWLDDYVQGNHKPPFTPDNADKEFKLLAERAITNLIDMPVNSVAQTIAIDGFRPGAHKDDGEAELQHVDSDQWKFFQRNHLDARQDAVHRAALRFGHSFVANGKDKKGRATARGLSPLTTTAIYDDPANDIAPVAAFHVEEWADAKGLGTATMWTETHEYLVRFDAFSVKSVRKIAVHGFDECPVTRFAPQVDLDGRTMGLVEPLIPIQDRLNQTIFDLLIAQSYSSFKVRTVTGMAPPIQQKAVYETDPISGEYVLDGEGNKKIVGFEPVIDPNTGNPVAAPISMMAKSVMWAEDPDVKFGTLDHTPLDGHISASKLAVQHFTAKSQTPPHYALGEIANLSAEALDAAQQTLDRLVDGVKVAFGEAWERVVRLAMFIEGKGGADDYEAEVIWADKDARAWAAFADGAGKLVTELGIPQRGLWPRVPGVSQGELSTWEKLKDEEDKELQKYEALMRATGTSVTPTRPGAPGAATKPSPPRRRSDDAV